MHYIILQFNCTKQNKCLWKWLGTRKNSMRLIIIRGCRIGFLQNREFVVLPGLLSKSSGCTYLLQLVDQGSKFPRSSSFDRGQSSVLRRGEGTLGIQSYYLLVAEGRGLLLFDPFSPDKVFIPLLAMASAIEVSPALTYNRF